MEKYEIGIPVIDTYSMSFDKNCEKVSKMSMEEYYDLVYEEIKRTNKPLNEFLHRKNFFNGDFNSLKSYKGSGHDVKYKWIMESATGYLLTPKKNPVTESYINGCVKDGRMTIFFILFDKESLEYDGESELKFWKKDSKNILDDYLLDKDTKLMSLPKRDLYVRVGNINVRLKECKIAEFVYGKKYGFGIIVNKVCI